MISVKESDQLIQYMLSKPDEDGGLERSFILDGVESNTRTSYNGWDDESVVYSIII